MTAPRPARAKVEGSGMLGRRIIPWNVLLRLTGVPGGVRRGSPVAVVAMADSPNNAPVAKAPSKVLEGPVQPMTTYSASAPSPMPKGKGGDGHSAAAEYARGNIYRHRVRRHPPTWVGS